MGRTRLSLIAAGLALAVAGCSNPPSHNGSGNGDSSGPTSTTSTTTFDPPPTTTTTTPPGNSSSSGTKQLNQGSGAVFNGSNTGGVNLQATTNYLNAVVKDVDGVWSRWFVDNGMAEPMVNYTIVQPGQTLTSLCMLGNSNQWTSKTQNAMFCDQDDKTLSGQAYDGTVWLPVETFASMWSGNIFGRQANGGAGDFAAAILVAHEYGHKVQEQLTLIFKVPTPPNPQMELIADCFAGVWAWVAFTESKLASGDLDVALHALGSIGDTVGSHGTNAQREDALRTGLNGTTDNPKHALPSNCTKKYWPALPMN